MDSVSLQREPPADTLTANQRRAEPWQRKPALLCSGSQPTSLSCPCSVLNFSIFFTWQMRGPSFSAHMETAVADSHSEYKVSTMLCIRRSENNFGISFLLPPRGSRGQTQVIRPDSKQHLPLLSHHGSSCVPSWCPGCHEAFIGLCAAQDPDCGRAEEGSTSGCRWVSSWLWNELPGSKPPPLHCCLCGPLLRMGPRTMRSSGHLYCGFPNCRAGTPDKSNLREERFT